MLILTRLPGQRIMIGDNIILKVMAIGETHCRLGISAPDAIEIHRAETVAYHREHAMAERKPKQAV